MALLCSFTATMAQWTSESVPAWRHSEKARHLCVGQLTVENVQEMIFASAATMNCQTYGLTTTLRPPDDRAG
jgi:hypothetical protein